MKNRIVILGAGESGVGAALLANQQGFDVFVSDAGLIAEKYITELTNQHIAFEQSGHNESLILSANEIIKSPGIPEKAEIIKNINSLNDNIIFAAPK